MAFGARRFAWLAGAVLFVSSSVLAAEDALSQVFLQRRLDELVTKIVVFNDAAALEDLMDLSLSTDHDRSVRLLAGHILSSFDQNWGGQKYLAWTRRRYEAAPPAEKGRLVYELAQRGTCRAGTTLWSRRRGCSMSWAIGAGSWRPTPPTRSSRGCAVTSGRAGRWARIVLWRAWRLGCSAASGPPSAAASQRQTRNECAVPGFAPGFADQIAEWPGRWGRYSIVWGDLLKSSGPPGPKKKGTAVNVWDDPYAFMMKYRKTP